MVFWNILYLLCIVYILYKFMIKLLLPLLILSGISLAHGQNSITGKVSDSRTKETLIGVSVQIDGTSIGTATDISGRFTLNFQGKFPVNITLSYLGYDARTIQIQNSNPVSIELKESTSSFTEVVVTSRRRKEEVQDIPIPITVLGAKQLDYTGSFNVNRVKEMAPSVQLYSSNPRNTTINIRGLGSAFGLTNDGIDPGVGFYVDGVYYARAAATTIDFIDIEQVEVLRGPQGTLFGKNTTAGAFNITSRKPSFTTIANAEMSFGNYGFTQAKASVSGPIIKDKLAARLSFTGTQRDGLLYNQATQKAENSLNNVGSRFQLLYRPNNKVEILAIADYTRQRPTGYAQVVAGVAPTKRADYRQFESIIRDLNYDLPSRNPYDRLIDHNTPWQSDQDFGGASINIDVNVGSGKLTSTTAWRFWNWGPSNDRDFTGLEALRLSQAPSIHHQYSQEFRYSNQFTSRINGVFGIFLFGQELKPNGAHTEQSGKDQWRFVQNSTSAVWQTPGLLDGYGIRSYPNFKNFSGAIFGQVDIQVTEKFTILPGIRVNYDEKSVDFRRDTFGGMATNDPAILAIQNSVYRPQAYTASDNKTNTSGQLTLKYQASKKLNAFATYAINFKPIGLNLGGLPSASDGRALTELASIRPEQVNHFEIGTKTQPIAGGVFNVTIFNTDIKDFQTQVQSPDLAVNRGYLANAEKVNVRGAEVDMSYSIGRSININGALCYTEGTYVKFTNAPPPFEETGGPTFKDISGGALPGISKWSATLGFDWMKKGKFLDKEGEVFFGADGFYRSGFSSSPSPSAYLNVDGYALMNGRFGFRTSQNMSIFIWSRNLLNQNYMEFLLPAGGNAGHFAGVLGDQRTYGITLRLNMM